VPAKLLTSTTKAIFAIWIILFLTPNSLQAAGNQNVQLPSTPPGQALISPDAAPVFILLTRPNASELAQIKSFVERNHGQVTHTFPEQALIASLAHDQITQLTSFSGVAIVATESIDLAAVTIYGPEARQYAGVWNSLINPPPQDAALPAAGHPDEPHHDALIAPDLPNDDQIGATSTGVTPDYYQTSSYMAGSVAVGIVLVESSGKTDPSSEDWSTEEKQQVFNEIVAALNWWAQLEPRANLSFVYDNHFTKPLPTTVEPITRPYSDQHYWINEAMAALGYTAPSYFTRVRDYNNHLRHTYHTNWAFTIFVVDSSADSDNRFSDKYFAYAYLGGPFMVMTSGNNGYGLPNMDAVAAHEMGHIFHALDQYSSAYQPCARRSGYLYVENQNSLYEPCASNVASIMRGQTYPFFARAIDPYAAGQIGWRDSDGDNILDPLDTSLPVTIDQITRHENGVSVNGSAQIIPYPSPSQNSVTINTLTGIQYRLNGDTWQPVIPADGAFDSTTEPYQINLLLPPGMYQLEVAAVDSAGNMSTPLATETVAVFDPLADGLDTQLYPLAATLESGQPILLDGVSYHLQNGVIANVQYKLADGPWQPAVAQDGAFDSEHERFHLVLPALEPGDHALEVFATDDLDNIETNGAQMILHISAAQNPQIFLPLIVR
jgi:hypothetical protein